MHQTVSCEDQMEKDISYYYQSRYVSHDFYDLVAIYMESKWDHDFSIFDHMKDRLQRCKHEFVDRGSSCFSMLSVVCMLKSEK